MKIPAKFIPDMHPALVLGLAVLLIPRFLLHDLKLVPLDSLEYQIAAMAPYIIWFVVAVWRKTTRPFYDYFMLGLTFGLLLAITHQITWEASWGDEIPRLRGSLDGQIDPTTENIVLRSAAFISSLITGAIIGSIFGLIGLASSKVTSVLKSKTKNR